MSRKFSDLDVAASLGSNNEFLVDQNGVPKRVTVGTVLTSAQNAGSIAGAAAGAAAASVIAQDIASTALVSASAAGYAAGSAAAQAVFVSLEERVSALEGVAFATSAYVDSEIASVSARLQTEINAVGGGTFATSAYVDSEITSVSARLQDEINAVVYATSSYVDSEITSVSARLQLEVNGLENAWITSTANASTYGYRVSAGQGLTYQVLGTPGNGNIHIKFDFVGFTSTTIANWSQRGHSRILIADTLNKESTIRVSSLAYVMASIAGVYSQITSVQAMVSKTSVGVQDEVNAETSHRAVLSTQALNRLNAGQIITGGALVSVYDIGDVSTGTLTLDYGLRPMQRYNNMGAHTLAPDTQTGYITLVISNSTGAGAITTSGWTVANGDAFDTSVGSHFICYVQTTENDGSNFSHIHVVAMQ